MPRETTVATLTSLAATFTLAARLAPWLERFG